MRGTNQKKKKKGGKKKKKRKTTAFVNEEYPLTQVIRGYPKRNKQQQRLPTIYNPHKTTSNNTKQTHRLQNKEVGK